MIRILFFASLRERLGEAETTVAAEPALSTVSAVRAALAARTDGRWAEALSPEERLLVAVNEVMATPDTAVGDGDVVAFFPPVTGG
ncbi:MAG: molybdopterin converting factor subunit 1 [Alcanivorax sp.]|nr:molybdopterin converting factor subunit 1 [Alcanivorax sp.]